MLEREFRNLLLKIIKGLKRGLKQINEVTKSIQDLDYGREIQKENGNYEKKSS
jgi:hypothetical protein